MTAALLMIVRNEEDFLERNVRYHLAAGFDLVAVMNHCSGDGTSHILSALSEDRRVLAFEYNDPIFDHGRLANLLLQRLLRLRAVDWVFPLDADEFFYADGGVRGLLGRMGAQGISYGTVPWLTATLGADEDPNTSGLGASQFYRPWPERAWQHDGMFRKAFCRVHDGIEIVVGGHYFKREVNPTFFGACQTPAALGVDDARIYHFEFRGSPRALMAKWGLLASFERDSSSDSDAPWIERLRRLQGYVREWHLDPQGSSAFWNDVPRTFWGTPVPPERIESHRHVADWLATFAPVHDHLKTGLPR